MKKLLLTAGAALALTLGLAAPASAGQVVHSGSSADAAGLNPFRDHFRDDIGGGNTQGLNGSFGGVRREINWDGTPVDKSEPNFLPPDFFNTTSPRGAVFSGAPNFMVSGAGTFGTLDATYTTAFEAFTAQKIFAPIGATVYDVKFFVPGTTTPATTSGFGAVFTDVDTAGVSKIDFFGLNGELLKSVPAPVSGPANGGFSFAGLSFTTPAERISSVRITTGNQLIATEPDISQGGAGDVVALDDLLYGEPRARTAAKASLGKLKKVKLKKGKKKNVTVQVSNSGETTATGVKACLKPADKKTTKAISVKGKCKTLDLIAAQPNSLKFKLASKGGTGGFKLKLQVSGGGIAKQTAKLKVQVS
jgi:hypothetical protein